MDLRLVKLNKIQESAVNAWISNDGIGTIISSQRTGKTLMSFKAIYRLLELGKIKLGDNIRYRAEVSTSRKKTLYEDERKACIKILGKDVFSDFNISFLTYQAGLSSDSIVMEIFDEIDCGLSSVYSETIKHSLAKYKLGLTGTVQNESNVYRDDIDRELLGFLRQGDKLTKEKKITSNINKAELLDIILPVVFEYPFWKALSDGIISPFETTVISHTLGQKEKYLQVSKKYPTLYNEKDFWRICETNSKKYHLPFYVRQIYTKKMTDLLYYNMNSKRYVAKKLLEYLNKTILFSVGKKLFDGVTDNIADSKNIKDLLEDFDKGKINEIASSKMIGRGTSLSEIDSAIFISYYGKWSDVLQKLARVCTYKEDKVSKVYFIVTNGTYEEKWFKNLTEIKNRKGEVIHNFDLNITKILDSRNLWLPNAKNLL